MTASAGGDRVVIDSSRLADFLRSSDGPVLRHLLEVGENIKNDAKIRVHVYAGGDPNRSRQPGTLRDSIVKRVTDNNNLPSVEIGSDDPIALIHHDGRGPIDGRPRLVFWSGQQGSVISVSHVGPAAANPYLTDAAQAAGLSVNRT